MARVFEIDGAYVLQLSRFEKIFAFRRNPGAAVSSLESKVRVNDPWSPRVLRGFRAPGSAVPYLVLLGTMRFKGGKDFAAIYRTAPVDIYTFSSGEFKRWIVTVAASSE